MRIARRELLLGTAFLLANGRACAGAGAGARIEQIERELGGRIGVSALNTADGIRIDYRANERFAMCSTFKAALVGAVLARVDRREFALDQPVKFGRGDLLPNAPVTTAHADAGVLDLETLCAAAIEVSDNTAANLLLSLIGGPVQLTAFFRQIGDTITRLDRIETELNANLPGDLRDTTTPAAMLGDLTAMLLGNNVLSDVSRRRITNWMFAEQNARDRIRHGLPPDWRVANKPGTGLNGATNDIALAWPPGKAPIAISVYVDAPDPPLEQRIAAIADVARAVTSALA